LRSLYCRRSLAFIGGSTEVIVARKHAVKISPAFGQAQQGIVAILGNPRGGQ